MNYLKCKMCGEDLTLHHEEDVGLCDFCYELNEKYDREIRIVLPQGALEQYESEDEISNGLVSLTKLLIGDNVPATGLGGAYGYGEKFENDVFMTHPYCWCDREDCPWCGGCKCPESAFHYYTDDQEVTCVEWLKYYEDKVPGTENPDWIIISEEVNKHRASKHIPVCDFCLGKGVSITKGGEPGKPAPNFWHKKSGVKVWWYKWIGRDMEVVNKNNVKFSNVLLDCVNSLTKEKSKWEGKEI